MSVDNLFYNGKAQARSIVTGCKKRFINPIDDKVGNAYAIIDYGDDGFFSP